VDIVHYKQATVIAIVVLYNGAIGIHHTLVYIFYLLYKHDQGVRF
jgi:hypothetical protein